MFFWSQSLAFDCSILENININQNPITMHSPSDWGVLMGDSSITAVILDRIIHRAKVIHLDNDSKPWAYNC